MREDLELIRTIARSRDVARRQCQYNLRDLTTDTCPECDQDLMPSTGGKGPFMLAAARML